MSTPDTTIYTTAFQRARLAAFLAMLAAFPDPDGVSYKGIKNNCLSNAKEIVSEMQRTNFVPVRPATFSVSREVYLAWKRIGLKPRETLESGGYKFEVYAVLDDPADATVDLRAVLKL